MTVATSESRLASKLSYTGMITDFDRLELAWNHARRKHAIVQKALTPQNYIVVFEKAVPIADALAYMKAGIVFCTMKSLPSYLAKARFAKKGIHAPFTMPYQGDEAEGLALTLGGKG